MADTGKPADENRGGGLAIAALVFTALAAYFFSNVFPIAAHADDWPGPGVGAAFSLELALVLSFVGLLLALGTWRPPRPTSLAWAALLCPAAIFALVGVTFPFVGIEPFCGQSAEALSGVSTERSSSLHELVTTSCGGSLLCQYLVPLLIAGAFLSWRLRRARPAPPAGLPDG